MSFSRVAGKFLQRSGGTSDQQYGFDKGIGQRGSDQQSGFDDGFGQSGFDQQGRSDKVGGI